MNWRAYVVPALFLALFGTIGLAYWRGRQAGEYFVRLHAADSTIALLRAHLPAAEAKVVHDTVRLTVVRHRSDTTLRVDTLWRSDTVRKLLAVERAACDTAIGAVESSCALKDSLIAAQNQKIKLLLHQPHSFFSGIGGKALILGGGFLLGRALH